MVTMENPSTVWIRQLLSCFGGCFGLYSTTKPTCGLGIRDSFSEYFWSSSTFDLENNGLLSQRSFPSLTTTISPIGSLSRMGSELEFVNHGLILWNESRLKWIGTSRRDHQTKLKRARTLSWNATYESVIARKGPFHKPVPLSEMVEFLVEAWDQDGIFD